MEIPSDILCAVQMSSLSLDFAVEMNVTWYWEFCSKEAFYWELFKYFTIDIQFMNFKCQSLNFSIISTFKNLKKNPKFNKKKNRK